MTISSSLGIAVAMVLAFAISALTSNRLTRAGARSWLLDHPNERSLHHRATPRSGGLAIALAILVGGIGVGVLTSLSGHLLWLAIGSLVIATVSFRDDLSHVHPAVRISAHLLVALMLVSAGFEIQSVDLPGIRWPLFSWLGVIATCLYIAWMINLYNFMDGMDGFAGGMAVFGFSTFAVLGGLAGEPVFAGLCGVIAAAAGGFLLFNIPPARIFMGDVGSSLLGFLAAGLSLWAAVDGIFPLWIAVLVFSPFIVDATFTLGRRVWRRERVWEAHSSHLYQRLVQSGWGHRKTALWEYLLMLLCCLSAVLAFYLGPMHQWWLLICWAIGYVILVVWVNRLEGRAGLHETVESL
jgi:UDP-N-acetylmuramyl pentapeptide phosphotransferase/UDP-N-acetylglucosamine-1-phosphate transferase